VPERVGFRRVKNKAGPKQIAGPGEQGKHDLFIDAPSHYCSSAGRSGSTRASSVTQVRLSPELRYPRRTVSPGVLLQESSAALRLPCFCAWASGRFHGQARRVETGLGDCPPRYPRISPSGPRASSLSYEEDGW
jgi:hypothetical protein